MIRKLIPAAVVAAALVGFSAAPSQAAQPQNVKYTGPGLVVLHNASPVQTYAVTGSAYETGNAAVITSTTPAVCSVAPTGPGKADVTFTAGGDCVLRYQAAGDGSFDALDATRAIRVVRLGF